MYRSLMSFPTDLFAEFDHLQRQMDRLFGHVGWPTSIRAGGRGAFPAINVGHTPENVEVYAFAPGLDPGKIEVSIDKGLLTLAGERADATPAESDKVVLYARERYAGSFKRVVSLPDDVDPQQVQASYRDGVLRVVIGRRESARPRRIEVH